MRDIVLESPPIEHAPERVQVYEAVVEHGLIRAPAGVRDGARVYFIVPAAPARPQPGTPEWDKPFEELEAAIKAHPTTLDEVSDDELNAIIHEVRAELYANANRG